MDALTIIRQEDLLDLKNLYEADKPLHVVTTVAIGHFIERFKKKPEWTNIVKFWSLNDSWKETGTFVMINANDDHILFDTLEPAPHKSLHSILDLIDYVKPMVFICFRDIFRPVVLDVIRVQNLEITFDSGTRTVYDSRHDEDIGDNEIDPPDGFYLDDLKPCHVEKMDLMWPQRHSRSHDFLLNCITQNPSTGLFSKETGELVAWVIMHETGAGGNFLVIDKYRRNGLGLVVAIAQGAKIRKLGYDRIGFISHQNKASLELFKNFGSQFIGNKTLSRYFDVTHATAQLEPTFISKINTGVQLIAIATSLGAPIWDYASHPALHGLWYVTGATTFAAAMSYIISKDTYKIIKESRKVKGKANDNKHAA